MERMTKHSDVGTPCMDCEACKSSGMVCHIYECRSMLIARLRAVEDVIGPTYDLSRLKELVEADRDVRCVVLPCKLGTPVYCIRSCWDENDITVEGFGFCHVPYFWKYVFLTREEAEKALEVSNGT